MLSRSRNSLAICYWLACLLAIPPLVALADSTAPTPLIKELSKPTDIIPFKAKYTLKKGGVAVASVKRELRQTQDGDYVFESYSKPVGIATFFVKDIIVERSQLQRMDNYFRPESYSYQRTGGKKDKRIKLTFDWENNKATSSINEKNWKINIHDHVQDKLLYQLSIMYDLNNSDKKLSYDVADGDRLKDYSFRVLGQETISTNIGLVDTVKIKREIGKKSLTIWCATNHNYLPVKIEQNDEDGDFDLYIESIAGI